MITLETETAELIKKEMESIHEKYQKPFNSMHEGVSVLREEYLELEQEIFFGYKIHRTEAASRFHGSRVTWTIEDKANEFWKEAVRKEAVQVAAMAARIIQELT
jgi:translation elongation factor EF-Ts